MARKPGKLDRMGIAESALSGEGARGRQGGASRSVADKTWTLFEEYRTAAIEAFTEAQGYHEERRLGVA